MKAHKRQTAIAGSSSKSFRSVQVSSKGSALYVERIEVSQTVQRSLTTKADKISDSEDGHPRKASTDEGKK
jgi:hypothetical protein